MTQSSKPKQNFDASSSSKTNGPTDNTRKVTMQNQASGSSTVPKRPRRTTTGTRTDIQPQTGKGDISQSGEESFQVTTSGAYPSQT